jgi:hypothetical protein
MYTASPNKASLVLPVALTPFPPMVANFFDSDEKALPTTGMLSRRIQPPLDFYRPSSLAACQDWYGLRSWVAEGLSCCMNSLTKVCGWAGSFTTLGGSETDLYFCRKSVCPRANYYNLALTLSSYTHCIDFDPRIRHEEVDL